MDFVSDALFDGWRLQALTVVDAFTREALAIDVDQGIKGEQVIAHRPADDFAGHQVEHGSQIRAHDPADVQFVSLKSEDQLDLQILYRVRERLVNARHCADQPVACGAAGARDHPAKGIILMRGL